LRQIFQALTQSEQSAILDPKGSSRGAAKDAANKQAESNQGNKLDDDKTQVPVKPKIGPNDENQQDTTSEVGPARLKKIKDPEKAAKVCHYIPFISPSYSQSSRKKKDKRRRLQKWRKKRKQRM
jgi:hypothetical protein